VDGALELLAASAGATSARFRNMNPTASIFEIPSSNANSIELHQSSCLMERSFYPLPSSDRRRWLLLSTSVKSTHIFGINHRYQGKTKGSKSPMNNTASRSWSRDTNDLQMPCPSPRSTHHTLLRETHLYSILHNPGCPVQNSDEVFN
jgi:hypothetical protein